MFKHYPDINHDGEKNLEDAVIFHSLMDAAEEQSQEEGRTNHAQSGHSKSKSQALADVIVWGLVAFLFADYLSLLLKGELPFNLFTVFMGLVGVVVILRFISL